MKLLIALLALSCFGQTFTSTNCVVYSSSPPRYSPSCGMPKSVTFDLIGDSPRVAVDIVNVGVLKQLGASVPAGTTDHIRVTVTNLDPATTKVTVFLTYFEDGEEVKVERTVSRNEVGAVCSHWVRNAARISGATANVEQLAVLP